MKFFTSAAVIFFISLSSFAGISLSSKDKGQARKPSSKLNYESDGSLYFEVNKGEVQPVVLTSFGQGAGSVKCIYATVMKTEFNDSKLCMSSGKLEFKNGSLMFNNFPLTYAWSIGAEGNVHESLGSLKQSDFSEMKKICADVFNGENCYLKVWYKSGQFDSFPNPM
ncbi:hypothetical protein [Bdellovibrio svalbardensis]|uniref:Uncharacterized protein n=1 Tax=Bdellovibrio svalbardensis TaxID=2972972 RepID=A0ABT6DIX2_9BACT|nr:hypothetical protein [Bdellovibrio svalbardensis]MDG0816806.1 hypothetical protein [Bdellovibrio svalbardensis]